MNNQQNVISYEYKQITAASNMESLWKDSMASFGWKTEMSEAKIVKRLPAALWIMAAPLSLLPWRPFRKRLSNHKSDRMVQILFKRDRRLADKQELNRLEEQYDRIYELCKDGSMILQCCVSFS